MTAIAGPGRVARAPGPEPDPARRGPRPSLVLAAALALEALVLLWPATIAGEAFFRRDVHLMWRTQAEAYSRAWSEGAWPLWSPLVSFGQPLLADANNQVLYPFKLLHLVLRPWTAYTLYAFTHLLLAGLGAAALARRLGLDPWPAGGAGAFWMASGPVLSVVDTWNQLAGAAWMPWSIAAGLRTLSGGGLPAALAWGAVTAMQVLAGSPESVVLSGAGVAVMALARLRRGALDWPRLRVRAGWALVAGALALGLSAGQWLPALDAARRAGRTRLPREARVHWSVHPLNLAQAICPLPLHRLAMTAPAREALFGAPDPFLPSLYLGGVGAALVAAALCRPTRRTVGLAVCAALAVVVAMGGHAWLYDAIVALVPPLQALRYPAKAMLLASLAWCVLCGFGLASLPDPTCRRRLGLTAGVAAVVSGVAAAALAFGGGAWLTRVLAEPPALPLAARVATSALLALLAGVLALRNTVTGTAAAAIALLDLFVAHHDLNPTAPVALFTREPPAAASARDPEGGRLYTVDYQEPGASRRYLGRDVPYRLARAPLGWDLRAAQALALREALFPPSPGAWGIEGSYDRDVPGLEPAPLALLKDAFRRTESAEGRHRLLRVGAVSRVAALHPGAGEGLTPLARREGLFADAVLVFGVPDPAPRASVVGAARVRTRDSDALAMLLAADFDPAREVVLSDGVEADAASTFVGSARFLERRSDRVSIETEATGEGWLVLVDAWDPGWTAHVDGRPTPVRRANLAFRAAAVPPGRHRVDFLYRPAGLTSALGISLASLAVLLAGAGLALRDRRGGGTA